MFHVKHRQGRINVPGLKMNTDTYTLVRGKEDPRVYHIIPAGHTGPTHTMKRMPGTGMQSRWGWRAYGRSGDPWKRIGTATDAIKLALRSLETAR
jgi:hypothetical protein